MYSIFYGYFEYSRHTSIKFNTRCVYKSFLHRYINSHVDIIYNDIDNCKMKSQNAEVYKIYPQIYSINLLRKEFDTTNFFRMS